jgi:hypothetical protein
VPDRKKREGFCSTGQSPQWAVVPVEEEEDKEMHNLDRKYGGDYRRSIQDKAQCLPVAGSVGFMLPSSQQFEKLKNVEDPQF